MGKILFYPSYLITNLLYLLTNDFKDETIKPHIFQCSKSCIKVTRHNCHSLDLSLDLNLTFPFSSQGNIYFEIHRLQLLVYRKILILLDIST